MDRQIPEAKWAPEVRGDEWAGGLFEGEGTIYLRKSHSKGIRQSEGVKGVSLSLAMTDEDVVQAFKKVIGYGTIRVWHKPPNKVVYLWTLHKKDEVAAVLSKLQPYLGQRRFMKSVEALSRVS